MTIHIHTGGVLGLKFSPEGLALARSEIDGLVMVMDALP